MMRRPAGSLFIQLFAKLFFHFLFDLMHFVGFINGMGLNETFFRFGEIAQFVVIFSDDLEILFGHVFDVYQAVTGQLIGRYELVELELDGQTVFVLGFLDEEDHEEGDDGGADVDGRLPDAGEMEVGATDDPEEDEAEGQEDGAVAAGGPGRAAGDGFDRHGIRI